jgi:hypothetical protein
VLHKLMTGLLRRQSNMGHLEAVTAFAIIMLGFPSGYELP